MLAFIGGSGFYSFNELECSEKIKKTTPYGDVVVTLGKLSGKSVAFLVRHGEKHSVPPHKINYRANIYALKELGVTSIVATNAVGGIAENCGPSSLIVPDQILDYTYGREHTYYDNFSGKMSHIDFTYPFDNTLRLHLIQASKKALSDNVELVEDGVYACMQGPRLETAAEINKLKSEGATLVGMTVMPEAALAREQGLPYASLCLSVNWAAGIGGEITMDEIDSILVNSVTQIRRVFIRLAECTA